MHEVTIGIPIFNVEKYIEKSLLSALNQTFDSIEYILVDGGGEDASMQIVQRIVKKHPRKDDVRILKQKGNLGPGEDRNLIIRNSTAKYLYFLDSDDDITLDCISILYSEIIKDDNIDFVNGQNLTLYSDGTIHKPDKSYMIFSTKKDILNGYLSHDIAGVMWNKLYRMKFLNENNIFTIHSMISEDVDFELQEVYYAKKVLVLPNITYKYYRRGGQTISLTSNAYKYLLRRSDVLVDIYFDFIQRRGMGVECEMVLVNHILSLLYELGGVVVNRNELFSVFNKVYSSVLKYCHIYSFFNPKMHFSMRTRLCALVVLIRIKYLRCYCFLLLNKIGNMKRLLNRQFYG